VADNVIHRLDKVDTSEGLTSLQFVADHDAPYAALLYERLLGRPFATHRDAVSEEVGVVMENAVATRLVAAGIHYRPSGKAEVVPGFDQAPDLVVPDELAPRVAIEAKIANDGGTARDKAGRIRLLVENERRREARGEHPCQVIACIDGRGFAERRQLMRDLLIELEGKLFTFRTLDSLVAHTDLARYVTKH
jgi:hypothetical protein